jgi:hypothetical protein
MQRVTALGGTLLLILLPWLASTSPASAQERGQPADAVTALRGLGLPHRNGLCLTFAGLPRTVGSLG